MTVKQRDTITIELCIPEVGAIMDLINARLAQMIQEPETPARQNETVILHSLCLKFFVQTLPLAIREATDEQGRLN
jgi:hypothetical protein